MRLLTLAIPAAWPLATLAAEQSVDADTGLATWQTETAGIQVRLAQISPDQARGFYQARGFSPEIVHSATCSARVHSVHR